jgi:hypothetical protein
LRAVSHQPRNHVGSGRCRPELSAVRRSLPKSSKTGLAFTCKGSRSGCKASPFSSGEIRDPGREDAVGVGETLRPAPARGRPAAPPGPGHGVVSPAAGAARGGDGLRRGRLPGPGGLEPARRAVHDRHHPDHGGLPRSPTPEREWPGVHDLAHPRRRHRPVRHAGRRHRAGGLGAARSGGKEETHGHSHRPARAAPRGLRLRPRRGTRWPTS